MNKIFILILIFFCGCHESNTFFDINKLPVFNAGIIPNITDFILVSINPSDKRNNVFYREKVIELDSLGNIFKWEDITSHPVLVFITKNEKMSRVFELEHELRKQGVNKVYYVSGTSRLKKENQFRGIARMLPRSNQAGNEIISYSNMPPPPSIEYMVSKYPYILLELKEQDILWDGESIEVDDIGQKVLKEVHDNPDFLILYHIDSNFTYGNFTLFLSEENESYMNLRDSLSLDIYGKKYNELPREDRDEIRTKIPIRTTRLNDIDILKIKNDR